MSKNSFVEENKLELAEAFAADRISSEIENLRALQVQVAQAVDSRINLRRQMLLDVLNKIDTKLKSK